MIDLSSFTSVFHCANDSASWPAPKEHSGQGGVPGWKEGKEPKMEWRRERAEEVMRVTGGAEDGGKGAM